MPITAKQIKKVLTDSYFNPKLPGPMRIIAEVGSEEYYITRTREIISSPDPTLDSLRMAIQLLVLAYAEKDEFK